MVKELYRKDGLEDEPSSLLVVLDDGNVRLERYYTDGHIDMIDDVSIEANGDTICATYMLCGMSIKMTLQDQMTKTLVNGWIKIK